MSAPTTVQLPPGFVVQQGPDGGLVVVNTAQAVPVEPVETKQARQRPIIGAMVDEKKPEIIVIAAPAGTETAAPAVIVAPSVVHTIKSVMTPFDDEVLKVTSRKEGEFDYNFTVFHLDMQGIYKDGTLLFDNDAIHKYNREQNWLFYIDNGQSYKLPFPWPLITFTEPPSYVDILFPLSSLHTRMGDVMDTKKSALLRTVSLKELAAIEPSIDATRKDAHMLIFDATLKGYSTEGIDVPLNTYLYSWLASGNNPQGVLRPLKHRVGRKLLVPSSDGKPLEAQCVMLPNQRTTFTKGMDDVQAERYHRRLYEMPDDVFDDPWISRGLQVNFDELRASLDRPISDGGYTGNFPNWLKVKAPPIPNMNAPGGQQVAEVMQSISMVQWFVLNMFEYVLQESQKELEKLPSDHKLAGSTIVQHNQTRSEYFFYVHKRPVLELINDWEERVKQAHVLSNCNLLGLAARPLDHQAASDAYALRREILDRERDNIDANPFVTCWATVQIRFWPFRGDPIATPNVSKYLQEEKQQMVAAVPAMSGIGATLASTAGIIAATPTTTDRPDVAGKGKTR